MLNFHSPSNKLQGFLGRSQQVTKQVATNDNESWGVFASAPNTQRKRFFVKRTLRSQITCNVSRSPALALRARTKASTTAATSELVPDQLHAPLANHVRGLVAIDRSDVAAQLAVQPDYMQSVS